MVELYFLVRLYGFLVFRLVVVCELLRAFIVELSELLDLLVGGVELLLHSREILLDILNVAAVFGHYLVDNVLVLDAEVRQKFSVH